MAIIPVPARFGFSEVPSFKLQRKSNQVRSKYTGHRQALVYPFAVWMLEGRLVEVDGKEAALFRSFLTQLEGVKNTFRLKVPGYYRPATGYNGNGAVYTAAESRAKSVAVTGLSPNKPIINEGEYFNIGEECKIASSSIASDANGRAVFSFNPPLRNPANLGVAIKLIEPTILMHAADDDIASWSLKPPFRQNSSFVAIEAIEL